MNGKDKGKDVVGILKKLKVFNKVDRPVFLFERDDMCLLETNPSSITT